MIERININEERLDKALATIKKLEEAIEDFKSNKKNIQLVSKYYGSNNWHKDKEAYENGSIPKIKASVLSEDAVWNMLDDVDNVILEMKKIVNSYSNKK